MNFRMNATTRKTLSTLTALFLVLLFGSKLIFAQSVDPQTTDAPMKVYLPVIAGGAGNPPATKTPTPVTPTPTQTPTQTPTPIVTVTPATPQPTVTLPAKLVGTWFVGNAPLNDFYDPTSGEWREVNGIGQMYLFAGNGDYTYTAFARFQTGACKSEVSVYKQGVASTNGDALTLKANTSKTRTVTICPSPHESIIDGPQDAVTIGWQVEPDAKGIMRLTITEQGENGAYDTEFYKLGMAESLVGMWRTAELTPDGFYNPATKTFNPNSADGKWYLFAADSTYRYGEHGFSNPDQNGCILEGWVYQTGTISVVGSKITIEPKAGILRLENSCTDTPDVRDPFVFEMNSYAWYHTDLSSDPKLVLVQLLPFSEETFKR